MNLPVKARENFTSKTRAKYNDSFPKPITLTVNLELGIFHVEESVRSDRSFVVMRNVLGEAVRRFPHSTCCAFHFVCNKSPYPPRIFPFVVAIKLTRPVTLSRAILFLRYHGKQSHLNA